MAYATRAEVLERLGLTSSVTSGGDLEARIDDALEAATVEIENDTGRVFAQSSSVRTFATPSDWSYVIDIPDVREITTLKFDDDDDGVFEVTVTAYELDRWIDLDGWAFDRLRLLDRSFPTGGRRRRRIEITALWGWAAVPSTINQAASLLAARIAQRPSTALFGVQSFGDVGTQAIKKDDDYWRLVRPYCRWGVA